MRTFKSSVGLFVLIALCINLRASNTTNLVLGTDIAMSIPYTNAPAEASTKKDPFNFGNRIVLAADAPTPKTEGLIGFINRLIPQEEDGIVKRIEKFEPGQYVGASLGSYTRKYLGSTIYNLDTLKYRFQIFEGTVICGRADFITEGHGAQIVSVSIESTPRGW